MPNEHPSIYLVAPEEKQWTRDFKSYVNGHYNVIVLAPEDMVGVRIDPESPARSVIVLYESDCPPAEWFERVRSCIHYMDLPLIAVTASPTVAMRIQLLSAGASVVCDAEDGPEHVLTEAENRCNIEPVMENIRRELLDPFIDATVRSLSMLLGAQQQVHSVYRKNGFTIFGDYSVLMTLTARNEGSLIISFPRQTGYEIGRRLLLPMGVEVNEELVQSGLMEVGNIIVGQAKGPLATTIYRFTMSAPNIIAGHNHTIRRQPGMPCLVASFTGEIGDFALQLSMDFNVQDLKGDVA